MTRSRGSDHDRHAAFANSLPLRRILGRRTVYSQEHPMHVLRIEWVLECGHVVTERGGASKRRCWQCGPRNE